MCCSINVIVYAVSQRFLITIKNRELLTLNDCLRTLSEVPDPPASVFVRCNSKNRSAEIWWQPGKENYAPILNFIVQYSTSFQPDLWYNIATNISQNNRRIVVSLSPWSNFTFRVIARNKIGLSLPSMNSLNICTTDTGVPDKNPENVIGEGDQPGNLVIFWTVSNTWCFPFSHICDAYCVKTRIK